MCLVFYRISLNMKFVLPESFLKKSCDYKPLVVFLLLILLIPEPLFSQTQQSEYKTIHLKFKEKSKPIVSLSGKTAHSGMEKVDKVSEKYNAYSIKRIFPDAGVFEEAHKAYGLHLWYEIKLRKDAKLKNAINDYQATDFFDHVEESRPYSFVNDEKNTPVAFPTLPSGSNDPYFSSQWHFENTGQTSGTPTADISLLKAWQRETGSPNVIVAVIDGGISKNHPDLKDALWVNADETPGNGKDDDLNGYVDDVNGYGFGDQSPVIYPNDHGSHVAGTIGALTNNGIGVAGIAGGNGIDKGVRLMSCAGFGAFGIGGFEEAMVYAADNGAVISQNSWGGGSTAIEAAIDYFIARAGYDNTAANFSNNIQIGPMAGGVVIFAAGNSDTNYGYPAIYDKVIAVASTDHNDSKSYFSNFGNWIDISAPGSNIFSTKASGYGYMSGTSMACPHVSGVAALIISNLQRNGLKPNEIWNRLRFSARSIESQNPNYYIDQLGWGRLDAYVALKEPDAIPPGAITDLLATDIHSTSLTLSWTASGENYDEGQAAEYEIRYSTSPIDEINFGSATLVTNPPVPPLSGEHVTLEVTNLTPITQYYIAMKSMDVFNNTSTLSNIISVTTLRPPTPELLTATLTLELYTGALSVKNILVKNIGDEDELLVRVGVPHIQNAPVVPPLGAKGRLFAINTATNKIEELDTKNGQIIHSISMPEPSSRIREGLAFDGVFLYYGKSKVIYKINAETGNIIRTFTINSATNINGLAWSGEYLYVSYYNNGVYRTLQIDSDDGTILNTFDLLSELAFYGKNNSLLIGVSGRLEERNLTTGNFIREIGSGLNPKCLAYSYVDELIFVSDEWNTQIKAVRPTDGTVVYTIPYPITTALAGHEHRYTWLETKENIITIPAGQTGEVPVIFNSGGLTTSLLTGTVSIIPINSNTPPLPVSVTLSVLPGTDIETAKSIDFGTQYLGFAIDTTIVIENRGSSDLVITQISANDTQVSSSISSATISPGQMINFIVSVEPNAVGPIDALLTITSNDPDEGSVTIPVKAIIKNSPDISLAPDTLKATLLTGESTTLSFTVTNTGTSTLYWNAQLAGSDSNGFEQSGISQNEFNILFDSTYTTGLGEISLKAASPENLTGLVYDSDNELIYAKALSENNFYKYDIETNVWTKIGLTAENFDGQGTFLNGKVYYGGSKLNIYNPATNSWASTSFPIAGAAVSLTNDDKYVYVAIGKVVCRFDPASENWFELPAVPGPIYMGGFSALSYHSGIIYASGSQWITGDGNTLFFKYLINSNTWIQSRSISGKISIGSAIDPSSANYFVVGMAPSGQRIQLSILDIRSGEWTTMAMPFAVGSISGLVHVGKSNASGIYFIQGEGTNFGFYETASAANWIALSPKSGTLNEGETQTVTVNLNAQGLFGGLYTSDIKVFSKNPNIEKRIPLQLKVIGNAEASLSKSTVDIGNVVIGSNRGTGLTIRNIGTAELVIDSITVSNPEFSMLDSFFSGGPVSYFSIPVGETKSLSPLFKPVTAGEQTGTFTFHSNEIAGNFQFTLKGAGVDSARLEIPTDTIKANLLTGDVSRHTFLIHNNGNGDTQYLALWGQQSWIYFDSAGYAMNIRSHQSREFEAIINATGLSQGVYDGIIWIEDHADGLYDHFEIPVQITVTNAPVLFINRDSLDFGEQFINGQYDSIIQVKNSGTLPLVISNIESDNVAFSISTTAPLTLNPGQSVDMTVRYSPVAVSTEVCHLTFTTNHPVEITQTVIIKGKGVIPPSLQTSHNEIFVSVFQDESRSQAITFSNSGGTTLKLKINNQSIPQPSAAGDFTQMADIPMEAGNSIKLTAITTDPASGLLYAQYLWYQDIYSYNPQTDTWSEVGNSPAKSDSSIGGAVILGSKMYCVYSDDPSKIYIYDMILRSWTTKVHTLGLASASITTDGNRLYVAGGGKFVAYTPATNSWVELAPPNFTLDGLGGLSYLEGNIYAHSANSTNFAKYNIALGDWENLIPIPNKAINGSTIDPVRKRYYAYGENYFYEYDIATNVWTVLYIPIFEIKDTGGMSYLSTPDYEGVYFTQGDYARGFAKYEPRNELAWLRTSQLVGEIEPLDILTIGINCNATNLHQGEYHGNMQITTNDPGNQSLAIPVTFTVKPAAPTIKVPELIADTVERATPTVFSFVIENSGKETLHWTLSKSLPPWLSLSKTSGSVSGVSTDTLEIIFTPSLFTTGAVADYILELNTNDPTVSKSSTRLTVTLVVTGFEGNLKRSPFTVSPNPFRDKLTVHSDGLIPGKVRIVLIDLTGRVVWEITEFDSAESTEGEIDGIDLPDGLYTCIFYVNNKLINSIRIVKE